MWMMLVCSSSSDNDVSVWRSSAASDPLESSSQHPCRQDSEKWQKGMRGYNDDNYNDGRGMLMPSPALAAQCYAVGDAGDDPKVSIAT